MATLNVGRVRLLNKGEYSVSAAYDFFDWVTYEGSSYVVTASSGAPAGTLPTDTSYWSLLADKGDKGDKGDTGLAASVSVGSVSTGAPDSPASVTNSGTENDAVFNFVIPKGDTGSPGPMGGVYSRGLGEMVFSLLPITEAGLHLLDGSLLQVGGIYDSFITHVASLQTAYPGLFITEENWQSSVTSYGVCGKFVYTEGVSLRIPKITGFIEGTLDSGALGDLVEAGLPDITAYWNVTGTYSKSTEVSGAADRVHVADVDYQTTPSSSIGLASPNLVASRASSIYGKSTTVQPQAIKGYLYMVVATATKTDIQVNIDNITTDLNGKAGTDLSNLSAVGKVAVAHLGMPSNKYVGLSIPVSMTKLTMPADGYLYSVIFASSSTMGMMNMMNGTGFGNMKQVPANSAEKMYLPVRKGDVVTVEYSNLAETTTMQFYYAEGSQP